MIMSNKGKHLNIYHIGTEEEVPIKKIALLIAKYFEKIRLQHRPNSSNIKIGIIKTNAIKKTYIQETQRSN